MCRFISREIHVSHCVPSNAYRSSHWSCSVRKGVLRNFTKFTGKHPCQSLFFNKVAGQACNFIKKETLAQVFSCKFCEISKNNFFVEHVWSTASIKGCLFWIIIICYENKYSLFRVNRRRHRRCSINKVVLRTFVLFTG